MKDKHGNEIKVGDKVMFSSYDGTYKQGVVSAVEPDGYFVDAWREHVWYSCPEYVEIVGQAKPEVQPKSLQQLKLEAQQEIQSVIQKHTALINSAGAMLNVTVNAYDAKGIMSLNQKQLIEVTASVTI